MTKAFWIRQNIGWIWKKKRLNSGSENQEKPKRSKKSSLWQQFTRNGMPFKTVQLMGIKLSWDEKILIFWRHLPEMGCHSAPEDLVKPQRKILLFTRKGMPFKKVQVLANSSIQNQTWSFKESLQNVVYNDIKFYFFQKFGNTLIAKVFCLIFFQAFCKALWMIFFFEKLSFFVL